MSTLVSYILALTLEFFGGSAPQKPIETSQMETFKCEQQTVISPIVFTINNEPQYKE